MRTKIKHKNSNEVIDFYPHYMKLSGIYGYIFLSNDMDIFFFYSDDYGIRYDIVSNMFEII